MDFRVGSLAHDYAFFRLRTFSICRDGKIFDFAYIKEAQDAAVLMLMKLLSQYHVCTLR